MRSSHLLGTALALAVVLAQLAPLRAQTVIGTVEDGSTGQPIVGAFVTLIDASTEGQVSSALTNDGGTFALRAPPGRFVLRVEQIGYATHESAPFDLASGQTVRRTLTIGTAAISLEGIEIETESRCRVRPTPETGLAVARAWDEARKALEATEWTERNQSFYYRTELFTRELEPNSMRVREDSRTSRTGWSSSSPFESLPADSLLEHGFVQSEPDGGFVYFAPDAHLLLSDEFLDTHCFRLAESEVEGDDRIGLVFEPIRGRRIPDVRGTLWLDRESAELRALDFSYLALPEPLDETDVGGGHVEFRRVANGAWIVAHWSIRMPRVEMSRPRRFGRDVIRGRPTVSGIVEQGGRIVEIRTGQGELLAETERAVLDGFVTDSASGDPIDSARVVLVGTAYSTATREDGSFQLANVPAGTYDIAVTTSDHAALGYAAPPQTVTVDPGGARMVRLTLPPPAEIVREVCGDMGRGNGVIYGFVRDPDTGAPAAGALVGIAWSRIAAAREDRFSESISRVMIETDETGRYRVCGIPVGEPALIGAVPPEDADRLNFENIRIREVSVGNRRDGIPFEMPTTRALRVDLVLGDLDRRSGRMR